jgi:hypothetical protein
LGIGTSTPSQRLHVYEASTTVYGVIETGSANSYAILLCKNPSNQLYLWNRGDNNTSNLVSTAWDMTIGTDASKYLSFYTNATERARIDSSGNLLVGTTSAGGVGISIYNQANNSNVPRIDFNKSYSGSATIQAFYYNGGSVGTIICDNTSTAYNTSSDKRLKENITDANSAGEIIDAIQVRQFDWKSDGSHQRYGMVAQELLEVAPEAVSQLANPEEMMGVDYSKLVPMLVKEIQQLRVRVAQLEKGA